MVELLYEHIVGINQNHPALSAENAMGVSALKLLEYIENGNFKKELDRKISQKKYANLTTERFRELEASSSSPVQEPSCMTALACCCLNSSNSVETNQNGMVAELVFSENDKKTTISPPQIKNQIEEDSEKATLNKKISITASSETSANSIEIRENSPHNSIQNIGENGAVVRITEITQPTYKTSMEVPDSSQVSSSPSKSNPMPRPMEAQSSVR